MLFSDVPPTVPKYREHTKSKTAIISWSSEWCRSIVSTSTFSITASIALHTAVIAILLFDKPIPKKTDSIMSVELISSHLIDKIKTNPSEKITKSTIPAKVRKNKQSSDQESRENPLDPIKNDKIIIGNRELSYFVRDVATDQRKILPKFEGTNTQIKDDEPIAPQPPKLNLTKEPNLKPNSEGSTKHIGKLNKFNISAVKDKNDYVSPRKTIEKVSHTVKSTTVSKSQENKEHKSTLVPIFLKWVPTQKPPPPHTSQTIQKKSKVTINPVSRFGHNLDIKTSIKSHVKVKNDIDFPLIKQSSKQKNYEEIRKLDKQTLAMLTPQKNDPKIQDKKTGSTGLDNGNYSAFPKKGNPKPVYPLRAVRKKWEGRVILHVEVLRSGTVGVLRTITSSGYWILDQAAINAVRNWRFTPAKLAGITVPSQVKVPVKFKLDQ